MAAELNLLALYPVPPLGFTDGRALTFDMTGVHDPDFKAQLAQVIDAGFASSADALRQEVAAPQAGGRPRTIKAFSNDKEMNAVADGAPVEGLNSGSC